MKVAASLLAAFVLALSAPAAKADSLDNSLFLVFANSGEGFGSVNSETEDTYTVINFGAVGGTFPFLDINLVQSVPGLPNFNGLEWFAIGTFSQEGPGSHVLLSNAPGSFPSPLDPEFENGLFAGLAALGDLTDVGELGGFGTNVNAWDFWSSFPGGEGEFSPYDYSTVAISTEGDYVPWDTTTVFSQGMGIEEISVFPNPFYRIGTLVTYQAANGTLTGTFTPVPEPSAVLLLLGIVPLAFHRRRRKAQ